MDRKIGTKILILGDEKYEIVFFVKPLTFASLKVKGHYLDLARIDCEGMSESKIIEWAEAQYSLLKLENATSEDIATMELSNFNYHLLNG